MQLHQHILPVINLEFVKVVDLLDITDLNEIVFA